MTLNPTPTPVPVLPMFDRPAAPRPCSRLARRRALGDALLGVAFVLGLIAAMSLWIPGVLLALTLLVMGARLSPRWRAYVDLGRVTCE